MAPTIWIIQYRQPESMSGWNLLPSIGFFLTQNEATRALGILKHSEMLQGMQLRAFPIGPGGFISDSAMRPAATREEVIECS